MSRYDKAMYAVVDGDYKGSYIIPVDITSGCYIKCFQLPEQRVLTVPETDYRKAIDNELLDKVADLEESVYDYIYELYKHKTDNN